jgi:hypothetical protein
MISLALSIPKPGASSEIADASAPAADGKGAKGAFSAVLASLGPKEASGAEETAAPADKPSLTATNGASPALVESGKITASAGTASQTAANGTGLPVPAKTGKILPDIAALAGDGLPEKVAGGAEGAEDRPEIEPGAGAEEAIAAASLVQLPVSADTPATAEAISTHVTGPSSTAAQGSTAAGVAPLAQVNRGGGEAAAITPEASADHSTGQAGAKAAHAFARQSSPATAEGASLAGAALAVPPKREGGKLSEAPTVALHVAPEAHADRGSMKPAAELQPVRARETAADGLQISRTASAEPAPQGPFATIAHGFQAESTHTGRPIETARPVFQSEALQDLARAVDRLAAAREALAPASATLAVKHADFGELSLRFEQQREGQLAVQLSASDPSAHRAIAAAVGERGAAVAADSHTGNGQSQAQARGAAAERDASGGNTAGRNAERQDHSQQRRSTSQTGQPGSGDNPPSGIFA